MDAQERLERPFFFKIGSMSSVIHMFDILITWGIMPNIIHMPGILYTKIRGFRMKSTYFSLIYCSCMIRRR